MRELKQSQAANVMVFMADSTDHITGKTGLTLTVTLSKDGGAFNSISPTVTERTSGWYNVALTSSHPDTPGDLVVRCTAPGADPAERVFNVVANVEADSYDVLSNGTYGNAALNTDLDMLLTRIVGTLATGTHNPQSGDAYARLGAPVGASIAADLAAIENLVDDLEGRLTDARAGYLDNLNTGVPLSAAGVDAIFNKVVEGTLTFLQIERIKLASLAGKSSGGGTATVIFKGADGTTTRITATVDADGNRTAIIVNGA